MADWCNNLFLIFLEKWFFCNTTYDLALLKLIIRLDAILSLHMQTKNVIMIKYRLRSMKQSFKLPLFIH